MSEEQKELAVDAPNAKPKNKGTVITLTTGGKAEIRKGKGKDVVNASELMGGKEKLFIPALMEQLVKVDGKKLFMDAAMELPLKDFTAIQTVIQEENF